MLSQLLTLANKVPDTLATAAKELFVGVLFGRRWGHVGSGEGEGAGGAWLGCLLFWAQGGPGRGADLAQVGAGQGPGGARGLGCVYVCVWRGGGGYSQLTAEAC
jgi:hypothetical protein